MNQRRAAQQLTVHLSADAVEQLKEAAAVLEEDLDAFVVRAALDRARVVLADDEWSG